MERYFVDFEFVAEVNPDTFSSAIMLTERDFSHARARFEDLDGKMRIFDNATDGTKIRNLKPAEVKAERIVRSFRVPMMFPKERIVAYMRRRVRKRVGYSVRLIVNQVVSAVSRFFGGRDVVVFRVGYDKMICSREQFHLLKLSMIADRLDRLDEDLVRPWTLCRFLAQQDDYVKENIL